MCSWVYPSHILFNFIWHRIFTYNYTYLPLCDERISIWQSVWANHSPNAQQSVPAAFANPPPFHGGAQTSVYKPLKRFLKIISAYPNRLAVSSLLFSIITYEATIVMFSSQIIHSHYMCRLKWMVFNKEEESPCEAAESGNKGHRNTLLKHIAMLRERKLVIHHARVTAMLCYPTAIVCLAACTRTRPVLSVQFEWLPCLSRM